MRVKDLIKELQTFDPETPISHDIDWVEELPAYIDCSCYYIDEEGRSVYTRQGNKVIFHCREDLDIIWNCLNNDPYVSLEEIKKKFVFDNKMSAEFISYLQKEYDDCKKFQDKQLEHWEREVKEKMSYGYTYLKERGGLNEYHKMVRKPRGSWKLENLCGGEIKALIYGNFELKSYDLNYDQYIVKIEK